MSDLIFFKTEVMEQEMDRFRYLVTSQRIKIGDYESYKVYDREEHSRIRRSSKSRGLPLSRYKQERYGLKYLRWIRFTRG